MSIETDGRDLDRAAATGPQPYPAPLSPPLREGHLQRVRRHRRAYFRWGWLVMTPGIILFAVSMLGLVGRSARRGTTPLFVSHPTLAGWLLAAGLTLFAASMVGIVRAHRRMQQHHRLLVSYGVPAADTGLPAAFVTRSE